MLFKSILTVQDITKKLAFSPTLFSFLMSISALHITSISLLDRKPSPSVSNTLKQTEETKVVI